MVKKITGLEQFYDSKAFIEYSIDMDDIYENIEKDNPSKKSKMLIVFDDMIPVATELFISCRNLNISLFFYTQSYFAVPKNIRVNSTHYFIMKVPNKREFKQIAFNNSSDINFKDVLNLYKKFTAKPYSFLVIDATLALYNLHILERIFKKDYKSLS